MLMSVVLSGFLSLSIIISVFILIKSLRFKSEDQSPNRELNISIIIAAKNEESNIDQLLQSLSNIAYPKEKFEIIFIDDNSNDRTFEIAKSYQNQITNLRVIQAVDKKYPAKKGALDFGIQQAKFDYILITDADCEISNDWLKYFSKKFLEGFDFVFGNVIYTNKNHSIVGLIQQFEHLRSKLLYFAAAILGLPYSANGANFGFSKKAFYKITGYEKLTSTLSGDDDLLIQKAAKERMEVGFIHPDCARVRTKSAENIKEYLNRKARHTSASYYYSTKMKIILGFWHLINILSLISPLFVAIDSIFLLPLLIKLVCDILLVTEFDRDFGYKFNIFQIIFFQILYEVFLCINIANGFRFVGRWK